MSKKILVVVFILALVFMVLAEDAVQSAADRKVPALIAQITDPQLGAGDPEKGLARFRQEIDCLNNGGYQAVIICGDLVHVATLENQQAFLKELEGLKVPYFLVPGNHDIPRPELRQQFENLFGPCYYACDLPIEGYRLIALDTNLWEHPIPEKTAAMEAMLEAELKRAKADGKKIIIVGHAPIFKEDENEPTGHFNLPTRVRELLAGYFEEYPVQAYLAGHSHTAFTAVWHGVLLSNSETTSFSLEPMAFGFRKISLGDDWVRVANIPLGDDWVRVANIPLECK